jgi:hypothetical protein
MQSPPECGRTFRAAKTEVNMQAEDRSAIIQKLNDTFRQTFIGAVMTTTAGVKALSQEVRAEVLKLLDLLKPWIASTQPSA